MRPQRQQHPRSLPKPPEARQGLSPQSVQPRRHAVVAVGLVGRAQRGFRQCHRLLEAPTPQQPLEFRHCAATAAATAAVAVVVAFKNGGHDGDIRRIRAAHGDPCAAGHRRRLQERLLHAQRGAFGQLSFEVSRGASRHIVVQHEAERRAFLVLRNDCDSAVPHCRPADGDCTKRPPNMHLASDEFARQDRLEVRDNANRSLTPRWKFAALRRPKHQRTVERRRFGERPLLRNQQMSTVFVCLSTWCRRHRQTTEPPGARANTKTSPLPMGG
mmetsp:Transcript_73438/g.238848  ORF Transcript_73438/g.238848 Transcript_73438/m.238848 type:complete len:272 (+) Transcript_73438:1160-1975(+)